MVNDRENMKGVHSTGGSIMGAHGGGHGGGHHGGGHRGGGRRRGGGTAYVTPVVIETDSVDYDDDADDDTQTVLVRRRRVL